MALWNPGNDTLLCSALRSKTLQTTARKVIAQGDSVGLKTHQEGQKIIAEILFTSYATLTHHCSNGISFEGFTMYGFPSLSQDPVLRIKLSNLPFTSEEHLSQGIFDLVAPYGIVLEGGIMMDLGWFDGSGYAIIQIPSTSETSPADVIVTQTCTALITSIARLDQSEDPKVGPSSCQFAMSPQHTNIFID
ncbi:hypothetical protein [Absidia glauca]|uniref:Uncharacterized protein n=1 Tax=Absidia glauca TaxID=4829 RepID=A0A163IPN8_ABSGL|nr:hypothetical protein [Absidia glauca]